VSAWPRLRGGRIGPHATICGPEGYVRDRIAAYREPGVTVLDVTPIGEDVPALVGRLEEWLGN
jgi:hypothetical protein